MSFPFKVRTLTWNASETQERDLNAVPARSVSGKPLEIRAIILKFYLSLTSASTSDAIAADEFAAGLLQSLEFRDNLGQKIITDNPLSGRAVRMFMKLLERRTPNDPTAIAANSNTTNVRTFSLKIPLRLPKMIDPDDHTVLAAALKGGTIRVGWPAASVFGTGQTIGATTQVEVLLDMVECRKLQAKPTLLYGTKVPDTFDRYRLPIVGRPLLISLFRPQQLSNVFAANDFTDIELRGSGIDVNRQSIDNPVINYNEQGLEDTAGALPLGTSGSGEEIPVYFAPNRGQLSEVPNETDLTATLVQGAGAPALTTVNWGYVLSRPIDAFKFAEQIDKADSLSLKRNQVLAGLGATVSKGKDGNAVHPENPITGWVPMPVNLDVANAA